MIGKDFSVQLQRQSKSTKQWWHENYFNQHVTKVTCCVNVSV